MGAGKHRVPVECTLNCGSVPRSANYHPWIHNIFHVHSSGILDVVVAVAAADQRHRVLRFLVHEKGTE